MLQDNLLQIVSKQVISDSAADSVNIALKTGKNQIKSIMEERVCGEIMSLYATNTRNSLPLYHKKCAVATDKSKIKELTMKERIKLYSALYVSCQSRQANFFFHENHDSPPSLSDYGDIRTPSSRSNFLDYCMAIPFWYAFGGCDTVSQFSGKKTAWNTWKKLGNCTELFARLSSK